MDELQLRMTLTRVSAIAEAIERDLSENPASPEASELRASLAWLRYRLALASARRQAKARR